MSNITSQDGNISSISKLLSGDDQMAKKVIAMFEAADIAPDDYVRATKLCLNHNVTANSIKNWVGRGMTIDTIEKCLMIRDGFVSDGLKNVSLRCVDQLISHFSPKGVTAPVGDYKTDVDGNVRFAYYSGVGKEIEVVIGGLIEEFEHEEYPVQRVLRVVDDKFGGNIMAAYNIACEDSKLFKDIVNNKIDALNAAGIDSPYCFYQGGQDPEIQGS